MRYNKGTILAVLLVLGYVGLEGYAVKKVSYRTKPDYIHDVLIQAKTVTEACNSDRLEYRDRFEKTLTRVVNSYRSMLADANPKATDSDISQQLADRTVQSVTEAESELSGMDCNHQTMKDHFQRYRLYARKTR